MGLSSSKPSKTDSLINVAIKYGPFSSPNLLPYHQSKYLYEDFVRKFPQGTTFEQVTAAVREKAKEYDHLSHANTCRGNRARWVFWHLVYDSTKIDEQVPPDPKGVITQDISLLAMTTLI